MKNLLIPVFVAALACGPCALADEPSQVSGTITQMDSGKRLITLSDGQTYALPQNLQLPALKVGDRVTIASEKQDGANLVQRIARN
jgi:hypothetical protein